MGLSEAYAALAMWAVSQGADNLPATPGLWTGKLGQFRVAINGHMEPNATDDGLTVPPLSMLVDNRDYLGCLLVVGPTGGAGAPGLEDEIIALAIANTPPSAVIPTPAETGGDDSHAAAGDDSPGMDQNPSFSKAEGRTP